MPRRRMKSSQRARIARPVLLGPGQLRANLEVKHQFRFTSTSGSSTPIYDSYLLTAAGVSATTAILGNPLFQSVKVNQIEIWTPPASQGAAVTCSVLFPSANNSPAREVSDTSVSVSQPSHVKVSPPPNSLCSFWQNGSSPSSLFTLTAPSGSIIDVWLSLVMKDGPGGFAANTAVLVSATVGTVYYCSLDSNTSAGSIYRPVSLATA